MKLLNICNKVIEYSFYLLFFLVPLAFTSDTSELFEFNKLWVTFILTIVIGTAWLAKMIIKKEFRVQKTPLDIPIGLFLISQVISTFISLDTHTSIWGYYSRFNGGLLSIVSYIFLYYAFLTNLKDEGEESEDFDFKRIYIFLGGILIFFVGTLISSQINKFTLEGIKPYFSKSTTSKTSAEPTPAPLPPTATELGGTDSGKIRLLVWQGAWDIWRNNPIFGTGV